MKIIKSDGELQNYDEQRIISAIKKSAAQTKRPLTDYEVTQVLKEISDLLGYYHNLDIAVDVDLIHTLVGRALTRIRVDVANEYRDYRQYKRQQNKDMELLQQHITKLQMSNTVSTIQQAIDSQIRILKKKHSTEASFILLSRFLQDIVRSNNNEILAYISSSEGLDYVTKCFNSIG